jgi:hypothetical protein
MADDKYAKEIRKTGFILEYKVAEALRQAGWTVISSKYYEDDFEGNVREIDLLAYKVSQVQQVSVYTTLLISCKKSEPDVWALIARDINLKDPNVDWWPFHAWSNDKATNYEIGKPKNAKSYHEQMIGLGVQEALSVPKYEVFAFQEMNRVSGAVRNDKNMFLAVTSLLKAQAYELGALSQRKKEPTAYQFNLLSVIDSDLVRLLIKDDEITQETIESEHYISRYIIKKRETFSRIRFIAYSSFKKKLDDYDRLHKANCKWFSSTIDSFYDEILKDPKRASILLDDFRSKIGWGIYLSVKQVQALTKVEKNLSSVGWSDEEQCATVEVIYDESIVRALNLDATLHVQVKAAFKKIYRYEGDFKFEVDDIPF